MCFETRLPGLWVPLHAFRECGDSCAFFEDTADKRIEGGRGGHWRWGSVPTVALLEEKPSLQDWFEAID